MQFVYGWPDYDCAVSNLEWEIGTARVLGLPVPSLAPYLGMVIGTSRLRVDAHGDNLARVETKGGYWRWAHDGWLETVYADCAQPTSSTRPGAGRWNAEQVRCTATT